MALFGRFVCSLARSVVSSIQPSPMDQICGRCGQGLLNTMSPLQQLQVRTRYIDWRMRRDVIKRQTVKEYAPMKLRINSLRKNDVLPKELQEIADQEIAAMPRNAHKIRLVDRCVFTSRSRGVQRRWRVSRIVWRHIADYNKMSGMTRATW